MSMPPSVLAMIDRRAARAVEQDGEIQLARDVAGSAMSTLLDKLPLRPGLVRDERLAEHFARELAHLLRGCRRDARHP